VYSIINRSILFDTNVPITYSMYVSAPTRLDGIIPPPEHRLVTTEANMLGLYRLSRVITPHH